MIDSAGQVTCTQHHLNYQCFHHVCLLAAPCDLQIYKCSMADANTPSQTSKFIPAVAARKAALVGTFTNTGRQYRCVLDAKAPDLLYQGAAQCMALPIIASLSAASDSPQALACITPSLLAHHLPFERTRMCLAMNLSFEAFQKITSNVQTTSECNKFESPFHLERGSMNLAQLKASQTQYRELSRNASFWGLHLSCHVTDHSCVCVSGRYLSSH